MGKVFIPLLQSPRCGAKTRQGTACRFPAVNNKRRCRIHGGAIGSGAPIGSQNALKHGLTTHGAKETRKMVRKYLSNCKILINIKS